MKSVSVLILMLVATLAADAASINTGKTTIPIKVANADLLYTPIMQVIMGTISVGTPPKNFDVAIFTGYVHTWIADKSCLHCGDTLYDGSKSSTFKDLKRTYKAQYIDYDTAKGIWTEDTFHLGNLAFANIPFGRVNQATDFAELSDAAGAIGLGLGKAPEYETLLQLVSAAKNLDQNVFSINFDPNYKDEGEMVLGAVDDSIKIDYTPILDPYDWTIPVNKIVKGDKVIADGLKLSAQVETSAPFIFLPPDIVEKIYEGTDAQMFEGLYILPKEFPTDVTIFVGTTKITVPKANMWVKALPKRVQMYRAAIQIGDPDTVLGIPFVKSNYIVFDFAKQAIGFRNDED